MYTCARVSTTADNRWHVTGNCKKKPCDSFNTMEVASLNGDTIYPDLII